MKDMMGGVCNKNANVSSECHTLVRDSEEIACEIYRPMYVGE
jgi:hypothetical protein